MQHAGPASPVRLPRPKALLERLLTRLLGRHPHWARRELARLDPVRDDERITYLLGQVRYGDPLFSLTLYTSSFAKQMAVPEIANVVHRGGRSPSMTDPRKRNDDTLLFFGEFMGNGYSSERGQAAIERLNEIHAGFPIANDLNVYTLGSLFLESRRVTALLGIDTMTEQERIATHHFWLKVGERMGITGMPESFDAYLEWAERFEQERWAHTPGGRAVTLSVVDDAVSRFAPRPLHSLARRYVFATFDERLLEIHDLPRPLPGMRLLASLVTRLYLWGRDVLPDPPDRGFAQYFGDYGACPELSRLGYQRPPAACPVAHDRG